MFNSGMKPLQLFSSAWDMIASQTHPISRLKGWPKDLSGGGEGPGGSEATETGDEDRPSVFDGATSGGGGCHIWCRFFFTDSNSKTFSNLFSHFLLSKFYSKDNRGRDLRMDNVEKISC